jgi:hypothetical protein
MDVSKLTGGYAQSTQTATYVSSEKKTNEKENTTKTAENGNEQNRDVFTSETGKTHKTSYTKGSSTVKMKNDAVRDWVAKSLSEQASGTGGIGGIRSGYEPINGAQIITDAIAKAEKTSEKYEDYWGVEATAERIYTFARALAGDNDEMFSTMKNAFLKGFQAALGERGSLPEISYKTKEKVLSHFDDWEKEIASKKSPLPTEKNSSATT